MSTLKHYSVEYWSSIEWGTIRHSMVLAESEDQVRQLIDKECAQEFRIKTSMFQPDSTFYRPPYDSLVITCEGDVSIPCIIQ